MQQNVILELFSLLYVENKCKCPQDQNAFKSAAAGTGL